MASTLIPRCKVRSAGKCGERRYLCARRCLCRGQPDAVLDEVVARLGQKLCPDDAGSEPAERGHKYADSRVKPAGRKDRAGAAGRWQKAQRSTGRAVAVHGSGVKTRKLLRNADLQDMPSPWAGDPPQLIAAYRDTWRSGRGQVNIKSWMRRSGSTRGGIAAELALLRFCPGQIRTATRCGTTRNGSWNSKKNAIRRCPWDGSDAGRLEKR